jgi:hypothetical protein
MPLPEPLAGYSVQCLDQPGTIYIVGGVTAEGTSDRLYRYNVYFNEWTPLPPLPIPLRGMGVTCYQGKIYVAGGLTGVMDRLYIYSISKNNWKRGADLPDPTGGANLGAWDGKLFLMGGSRLAGQPYTPVARVDVYDIGTGEWTMEGGTDMPFPTTYVNGVQRGPYYFIVGGISGDPNDNLDQTQRYDMAADTWELGPTFTSQRGINALSTTATTLYSQGGDENGGDYFEPTDKVEVLYHSAWPGGNWIDIDHPLPQLSLLSAGGCTEGITGGEIWAIGGADEALVPFDEVYYRHAEPCVSYGVDLPEAWENRAEAGSAVEYTVTITNTGVVTDYYKLEVNSTWNPVLSMRRQGPVGPGDSTQIVIAMDVPATAIRGERGKTEITANSISNPAVTDSTTITTVVVAFEVDVFQPDDQEDHPGRVLTYPLLVTNTGDFEDSYSVEISSTWETTATLTIGRLLPGEDGTLVVLITIPQDVIQGDWDEAVITITSQSRPLVHHHTILKSAAVFHRWFVPLALKN